jgi:hypothetical protein
MGAVIAWLEEAGNRHSSEVLDLARASLSSTSGMSLADLAAVISKSCMDTSYVVFELRCMGFPVQAQGEGYFIGETPIVTGVYVNHATYGPGRVRFAREGFPKATVDFRTSGIQQILKEELRTK